MPSDLLVTLLEAMCARGHPPDALSRAWGEDETLIIRWRWWRTGAIRQYPYTIQRPVMMPRWRSVRAAGGGPRMPHALDDSEFWSQPVELVMPLSIALAIHGHLLLALRHPDTRDHHLRPAVVRAARRLGDLLVARGALTATELAVIEGDEARAGGLQPTEPSWTEDRR